MKRKRLFIVLSCLAVLGLVLMLRLRQPPLYKVTILPTLGGDFTLPCAINEHGQIAGFSEVAKSDYHLFLWDRDHGMQDLGPGRNDLVDINNAGQIVGTMEDPNGQERAFLWDPNDGRIVLPTLGGRKAKARAINDLGQVVGEAGTDVGLRHAFCWDPVSGIRDLTPSSTTQTRAWSINDAGQVIVFATGGPVLINVNEDGASTSHPISVRGLIKINNVGDVAGIAPAGSRRFDVVVWRADSGTKRLCQLEADSADTPRMNDAGQMALTWTWRPKFKLFGRRLFTPFGKSCLWDPKQGRIPLDGYVSVVWHEALWLTDLNNQGCIVGQVYSVQGGYSRGVLFEPIPERWGD